MRSFIRNVGTAGIYNELEETMAGQIIFCASSVIPNGYLECNGATVSRTTYATLFAAIGSLYGAGDGATTFTLPDLRGEFLRGADRGRGVDSGRAVGSGQTDAMQGHRHGVALKNNLTGSADFILSAGGTGQSFVNNIAGSTNLQTDGYITDGVSGTPRSAIETRPRNVAMIPVIKY